MSRPREEEGLKAAELKTRDDVTDAKIKRVQLERAGSAVSSCLSMKSDWSMEQPIHFKGGRYPPDERVGAWLNQQGPTQASAVPPPPGEIEFPTVGSDSVSLSWGFPEGMGIRSLRFRVTWTSGTETCSLRVTGVNHMNIQSLRPGTEYIFSVATIGENNTQSQCVSAAVSTEPSAPERLRVEEVRSRSVRLRWDPPTKMEGVSYTFSITYTCDGEEPREQTTGASSNTADLCDLSPGVEYSFSVCTELHTGGRSSACSIRARTREYDYGVRSEATSQAFRTKPSTPERLRVEEVRSRSEPSAPERLRVEEVRSRSVRLRWDPPTKMEGVSYTFSITYTCDGEEPREQTTGASSNTADLCDLSPGVEYSFSVCTELHTGGRSSACSMRARTQPSTPERLRVEEVRSRSVRLRWDPPTKMEGVSYTFSITYTCDGEEPREQTTGASSNTADLCDLSPGVEYSFSVCTELHTGGRSSACSTRARTREYDYGVRSETTSQAFCTKPSGPGRVKARDVRSRSVTLCWERPVSMEIHIIYSCEGEEPRSERISPETTTAVLSDLRPGMEYTFNITTVLPNNSFSRACTVCVCTKTILDELVCELGMEQHLKNKLTLSTVLEIDGETLADESIQSLKSLPWCFLRRLMMVNVTARSVSCAAKPDTASQTRDSFLDMLFSAQGNSNEINPLDLLTAVFLCSDGFLQQEMVLKMSMCQFSVPLLLPKGDAQQCTLVLWAMQDIVKKFRPHSLADPRGFVEGSIVLTDLPLVSFVRLGSSSLSKSQILNHVLSNPQQYHNTFIHRNMVCGDTPRKISNGLVEISWYLPCGNRNIDIFSEPVAIANLRGDLSDFQTQYSFLCHTSAAVFVFCDDFGIDCNLLGSQHSQTHLFLVSNSQSRSFNKDDFRRRVSEFHLQRNNIVMKSPEMNDSAFVKKLRLAITDLLKGNLNKISVEQMSVVAHKFRIPVDEDYVSCQQGKQMADAITVRISDIPEYKKKMLPLQGTILKQLAKLEKEECRLKNAGVKNIEMYKSELSEQKQKLRE
ncbi:hypothetical protein AAFF_G00331250 [Aldrovandia affinis]|uniref:Fibronectin type-III domain-containing protein n=1 Tax=Aldrovandia affinis TaxID=143900 RepID=A0AAD7W045_9TELE|nr:hypothetical protein AAFF_G00331250 [Aldrovandia affinis]